MRQKRVDETELLFIQNKLPQMFDILNKNIIYNTGYEEVISTNIFNIFGYLHG